MESSPLHVFPSPEYPALQAQVYDPGVLLHTQAKKKRNETGTGFIFQSLPLQILPSPV